MEELVLRFLSSGGLENLRGRVKERGAALAAGHNAMVPKGI